MRRTRASAIPHRRRREGKTDYRLRLKLLKSGKKRLVVRGCGRNMLCQVVEHGSGGDKTLFTAEARELRGFGWRAGTANVPAAYLTSLLCGVRAKGAECVLDMGMQTSVRGCRVYAALKGAADGGICVPFSEDNLPDAGRIAGKHIAEHGAKASGHAFAAYRKAGVDPKDMAKHFEGVKAGIMQSGGQGGGSRKRKAAEKAGAEPVKQAKITKTIRRVTGKKKPAGK